MSLEASEYLLRVGARIPFTFFLSAGDRFEGDNVTVWNAVAQQVGMLRRIPVKSLESLLIALALFSGHSSFVNDKES